MPGYNIAYTLYIRAFMKPIRVLKLLFVLSRDCVHIRAKDMTCPVACSRLMFGGSMMQMQVLSIFRGVPIV
jgi:hypothetical protein